MPEVGAAVKQLLHGYDSHAYALLVGCRPATGEAGPWHLRNAEPVSEIPSRDRTAIGWLQAREVSPLASCDQQFTPNQQVVFPQHRQP
jgi:hypothetical protein